MIDPRALRTSEAPEDATQACIASRMLSSSVSPRQTLLDRPETIIPTICPDILF